MNTFDLVVTGVVLLLTLLGIRAGLLRSVADILGYLVAAPIAVAVTPLLSSAAPDPASPMGKFSFVFFGLLLGGGILFAQLFRAAVNVSAGDDISVLDRAGGGLLGAARALLVMMTIVLVFDRIIPRGMSLPFLEGSALRPLLSQGAALGLKTLPRDVIEHIDRLKRQQGL
jgi:membrane protein required for colicin V production